MTVGIIIVVLLLFLLLGVTAVLAVGLSVRGRVILLDAKVQVICDELGVIVPIDPMREDGDDEGLLEPGGN